MMNAWTLAGAVATVGLLVLPARAYEALRRWGWAGLLAVIAAVGLAAASRDIVDHDEVQHLHASWLLRQGHRPYRDFFEHHPPLYWQTAGRLVHALNPTPRVEIFRTARLVAVATVVAAVACLAWLGRELGASATMGLAGLLVPIWLHPAFEFRPDGLGLLFSLASLAALARAGRTKDWRWAALSGLCLSLAVAAVIKVWALLGVWLVVVGWMLSGRRAGWRPAGLAALAGLLVGMAVELLMVLRLADWSTLWRALVTMNRLRQQLTPALAWKGYVLFLMLTCHGVAVAMFVTVVGVRGWLSRRLLALAMGGFVLSLVTTALQKQIHWQYFLPAIAAAAVLLMLFEQHIHDGPGRTIWARLMLAVVLGLGLGRTGGYVRQLWGDRAQRRQQYERMMATVLAQLRPGQKVIASIPVHPIWAVDSRGWFLPPRMRAAAARLGLCPYRQRAAAEWLMADPPELVVAPLRRPGPGWNDPLLIQPNFRNWLRKGYRIVAVDRFWGSDYGVFVARRGPR